MSLTNGSPRYRLSVSEEIEARVRALGERAGRLGIRERFLSALRYVHRQLIHRPRSWGEKTHDYLHTGWTGYLAAHDVLVVEYAVDPVRRIVYLRDARPMPDTPLDVTGED
jgi:hypothetical protein